MIWENWGSKWGPWEHSRGGFCEIPFFSSVVHGRLSSLVLLLEKSSWWALDWQQSLPPYSAFQKIEDEFSLISTHLILDKKKYWATITAIKVILLKSASSQAFKVLLMCFIKREMNDSIIVVQSLSLVWLSVTARTAAHQAPLSFTLSQSLLEFRSIESVMLSNHLILCLPLLFLPSVFPSVRVFSSDSIM